MIGDCFLLAPSPSPVPLASPWPPIISSAHSLLPEAAVPLSSLAVQLLLLSAFNLKDISRFHEIEENDHYLK